MKIKEKVLKEVNSFEELRGHAVEYDEIIDLTLAEVGKVIDDSKEWYKVKIKSMGFGEAGRFCKEFNNHLKELKQKLGIK